MSATNTSAAVWGMLAERRRKTIKAKNLSLLTDRDYLYTAGRWSKWLVKEGCDLEPEEIRSHHVDEFIADILVETSPSKTIAGSADIDALWLSRRGRRLSVNGIRCMLARRGQQLKFPASSIRTGFVVISPIAEVKWIDDDHRVVVNEDGPALRKQAATQRALNEPF